MSALSASFEYLSLCYGSTVVINILLEVRFRRYIYNASLGNKFDYALHTKIYSLKYKYAIVNNVVYIRMSKTGDQHPYYVGHPEIQGRRVGEILIYILWQLKS